MQENNIKSAEISETFLKGIHSNRELKICESWAIIFLFFTFTFTFQYIIRQHLAFFNILIINALKARKKIFILKWLQLIDNQTQFFILTRFDKVLKNYEQIKISLTTTYICQ
jgi:hypothetical protein